MSAAEMQPPKSASTRQSLWRAWPVAVLALAAGVAFYFTWQTWSSPVPNGGLLIDAKYLDFGAAWEGSKFTLKLPVRNTNSSPVDVLGFATSCSCAVVRETGALALAPGEAHDLDVTIDLAQVVSPCDDPSAKFWPFKIGVAPQIKGAEVRQKGWIIQGKIKRLMELSPPAVYFGDDLVRGRLPSPATVKVRTTTPLDALHARFDRKIADVKITGTGKAFSIAILPRTDLPAGRFGFDVWLQPEQAKHGLPGFPVHVDGFVHEEIEPFPSRILLGALPIGESRTETVLFSSAAGLSFTLDHWECSMAGTSIRLVSSPHKEPQAVACCVTQRIAREGQQQGSVSFAMRAADGRLINVPVDIVYHGLDTGRR